MDQDKLHNAVEDGFKCQSCQKTIYPLHEHIELLTHGFFLLSGMETGELYISCPNPSCRVPLPLMKGPVTKLDDFFRYYNEIDSLNCPDFRYHHLPAKTEIKELLLKNGVSQEDFNEITTLATPSEESGDDRQFMYKYCSKHPETLLMGEPGGFWYFSQQQIERLLKIEQESNSRIFPRYLPYEPIIPIIDGFCWKYNLAWQEFGTKSSFHPEFTADNARNSIRKNMEFLKILEWLPRTLWYAETGYSHYALREDEMYGSIMLGTLQNLGISGINPTEVLADQADELWGYFHRDNFQNQLALMSGDFIQKYIQLYLSKDYGLTGVWNLLTQTFEELCVYQTSRRKRKEAEKKLTEDSLARVKKNHPEFDDYISVNTKLNGIKDEIGNYVNVKNNAGVFSILLLGEPGVGKTMFAEMIHRASGREGKFVSVEITSIPKYSFEDTLYGHVSGAHSKADSDKDGDFVLADKGTLFLDEIGDLDIDLQVRLLRAIDEKKITPSGSNEERQVDVALIFGTNAELYKKVKNGEFRKDLYDRISQPRYQIPPLRERKEDIELLVPAFIMKHATDNDKESLASLKVSYEGMQVMKSYHWPGNVRELYRIFEIIIKLRAKENLSDIGPDEIERRFENDPLEGHDRQEQGSDVIRPSSVLKDLVIKKAPGMKKIPDRETLEKLIQHYLAMNKGNPRGVKAAVARKLGCDPKYVTKGMKRYNIQL